MYGFPPDTFIQNLFVVLCSFPFNFGRLCALFIVVEKRMAPFINKIEIIPFSYFIQCFVEVKIMIYIQTTLILFLVILTVTES